jgi:periplasmic protein TonB
MSPGGNASVERHHGAAGRTERRAGRLPLVERKRAQRTAARRLVRARTRIALTPQQRAVDPLGHGRRRPWTRLAEALSALLMAAAIHVGVVVGTAFIAGRGPARQRKLEQAIRVEVREPPRPLPPRPPLPPRIEKSTLETPAPKPRPKPTGRPQTEKLQPQPPAPPPKQTPVRVVGLSLESTTEAGNGPTFAVGDTRVGQTADRAASPHGDGVPAGLAAPLNRPATRIPVQGVKYTSPKMRRKVEPTYPETLKAQGLEADVTVLVSIGVRGQVLAVEIVKGSPYPEFNQAARATALKQEFEPELRDGVPIASTLSWVYRFRLEGQ